MLTVLNLTQLVLYIAMLALAGQGALYLLAGRQRDTNFCYRLLAVIARPFTLLVRRITPRQLADRHVPVLTFCLVVPAYAVVSFEKIALCLRIGVQACR